MIKFYVNRELSQLLQIRLSRWKRWSREFLPPDPLGGLQSGYARQYTVDQAFVVFLGGHLVAGLHFSIPEAKQIIADLWPWLKKEGLTARLHANHSKEGPPLGDIQESMVFIYRGSSMDSADQSFSYVARTRLSDEAYEKGCPGLRRETYREKIVAPGSGQAAAGNFDQLDSRVLHVTRLCHRFMRRMSVT